MHSGVVVSASELSQRMWLTYSSVGQREVSGQRRGGQSSDPAILCMWHMASLEVNSRNLMNLIMRAPDLNLNVLRISIPWTYFLRLYLCIYLISYVFN